LMWVLFLGVLMGALDIAIIAPALPSIQASFKVGDRLLAWTFTIYVLFNLIGTPLMAKLSDTLGRRSVYILDVTLFACGSLVVALSPSFSVLLVGRALQGFGAGGIFPVASAVIGDTFPPEKRGSALGLIGAVFGLAFIIGPVLGGVVLAFLGWQWLFIVNLPIAAVVIVLSIHLLPRTRPESRPAFDWPGMASLSVLLVSLAYAINQIDTGHFLASLSSMDVWPFLLLAAMLLPIFIYIERRAADPILCLDLFSTRQAALANILSAGAGLGEVGMVFLPALAVAALGLTKSTSSYLLMPVVLAMAIGSPVVGRLLDRLGSRVVVFVGAGLLAAGMFLLSLLASSLAMFILSGLVIGLGLSALLGAPVRYIMLNEASAENRTAAQGAITLFTSVGQLISSSLVGAVAASQGGGVAGYSEAYLVIGGVALLLTFLTFGLKSRAEEQATLKRAGTVQKEPAVQAASAAR
ncbi:MAG TPA: MFS transporter, partial [Anaerolineales bacterium]